MYPTLNIRIVRTPAPCEPTPGEIEFYDLLGYRIPPGRDAIRFALDRLPGDAALARAAALRALNTSKKP